jgi:hypothetical protein
MAGVMKFFRRALARGSEEMSIPYIGRWVRISRTSGACPVEIARSREGRVSASSEEYTQDSQTDR